MPAAQLSPPVPRHRGFNVKFKSVQGCYEIHTIARSSGDALQIVLNEVKCLLKGDLVAFSVFVDAGPRRG